MRVKDEKELIKLFKSFGKKLEAEHGDMSDYGEAEILFMYFKGGFECASKSAKPTTEPADWNGEGIA